MPIGFLHRPIAFFIRRLKVEIFMRDTFMSNVLGDRYCQKACFTIPAPSDRIAHKIDAQVVMLGFLPLPCSEDGLRVFCSLKKDYTTMLARD